MYSTFTNSRSMRIIIGTAVLIGSSLIIRDRLIRYKRKQRNMPAGPTGYPLFGNLFDITDKKEQHNMNKNKCNKLLIKWGKQNDLFTVRIGNQDMIVINDLKLCKDLHCNKKLLLSEYRPDLKHSILGFSSFAFENNDNAWYKRRKFIMQTLIRQFTSKFINKVFDKHFGQLTQTFDDNLANNKSYLWSQPFVDISKINFIAVYELMFNDNKLINNNEKLFLNFQYGIYSVLTQFSTWFLVDQLPNYISSFFYNHNQTKKLLNQYVYPMVYKSYNQAIENKNKNNNSKSLIDYMINNPIYTNNKSRIFGDCTIMLTLGMAGTSIRLTSAIYCLATYPEVLAELCNELNEIYPNYINSNDFTFKKANQCHKLRAFIYEVIRLSNDLKLSLMRVNHGKESIEIKSNHDNKTYSIPSQCSVLMNTYYMEKYNNNYKYPNSVYLKHFLDCETNKFKKHDSFFGFGIGQRDCVGKSVAIKEMLYVLTNIILNKYKFTLPKSDPNYDNIQNIKPYYLRPSPYPGKDNLHKIKIIITKE